MRIFSKVVQFISPLIFLFVTPSLAFAQVVADPCQNTPAAFKALCSIASGKLGTFVGNGVTALMVLASLVSLGFLIYGGVKWIMSEGDKTRVEEARNTVVGAVIGLVIVFLSYLIISIILGLFGINFSQLSIPKLTTGTE